MTDDEMVKAFTDTITQQMRTHGVEFHDDCGERIKPGSAEEQRLVRNIARNVAQIKVGNIECQTQALGSST